MPIIYGMFQDTWMNGNLINVAEEGVINLLNPLRMKNGVELHVIGFF